MSTGLYLLITGSNYYEVAYVLLPLTTMTSIYHMVLNYTIHELGKLQLTYEQKLSQEAIFY